MTSIIKPFGDTSFSESEYRSNADLPQARDAIRRHGGEPSRVDGFVSKIETLMEVLEDEGEDFPWRFKTDSWEVFSAEVMLRRTKGSQVAEVYEEYLSRYRSPEDIVSANTRELRRFLGKTGLNDEKITALKHGSELAVENGGKMPEDPEKIIERCIEVGQYTAEATVLFAHNKVTYPVDTNIRGFLNQNFDTDFSSSDNQSAKEAMRGLVPSKPNQARAFYFYIIDLGTSD